MNKEITKIVCDKLSLCSEDLTKTEVEIVNILADIIQSKFDELKILNDELVKYKIDYANLKCNVEDLNDTIEHLKNELNYYTLKYD